MKATFSAWWAERSVREQRLLVVLGGVALAALLLLAVVRPLQAARGRALADIRTYQTLAARLRAAGPRDPAAPRTGGAPATIVATTAAGFGLLPQSVADGATTVVTLTDAPYDATLRWIAALEGTSALRIENASISSGTPGLVQARLVLR